RCLQRATKLLALPAEADVEVSRRGVGFKPCHDRFLGSDELYVAGLAQDQRHKSNAFPVLPFFCPPDGRAKRKGLAIIRRKSLSDKVPKRGLEPPLPCGNQLLKLAKAF